jgi:hypothetical protein
MSDNKSAAWTQHEHVAPPLTAQAEQLICQAGSPNLARHALDAAEPAGVGASRQDAFARRWGFTSYLELFEASTLVRSAAGKNWRIAALPHDGWIVWNETDLHVERTYVTREEAASQVPPQERA